MTRHLALDVVEQYMDGLFAHLARGTVAADAKLVIRRTPLVARCNRCGATFGINLYRADTWVCPSCEAERDYRVVSGREFTIDRIEVDGAQKGALEGNARGQHREASRHADQPLARKTA